MQSSTRTEFETTKRRRGPFVVAVEATRMPMLFTDPLADASPIIFANDSFLALTGYTKDQIVGKPLSVLFAELSPLSSAELIRQALASDVAGNWVTRCRRMDGTEFQADVASRPVHDLAGNLCQNFLSVVPIGVGYDRREQPQNEAYELYESAPGFIATTAGPHHRFTFANASYKSFVGRSELEGRTVADALPEVVTQGFVAILDAVLNSGVPYRGTDVPFDFQEPGSHRTTRRYADFVYQPVRGENGQITGLFCEGYDVTARKEVDDSLALVQAELIHLSRVNAMGTMAVTLAHELNQPLGAIANYAAGAARLLNGAEPSGVSIAHALSEIADAARRASDIISTLRGLTKPCANERTPFNLKSAIHECVQIVRAARSPSIALIDQTPDNLVMSADRVQIQQVVINLLQNACDAVSQTQEQKVTVTARIVDDHIMVCIADTGAGISLDAARDVFAWTHSTKEEGMGLGLSICRTIVESHRGRIWIEQSAQAGSELCFSIPLSSTAASA